MLPATLILGFLAPIDFSCPATCITDLQPRLEKLSGRRIRISPELRNEVVVIRATQVDSQDVPAKVADALCAKWVEQDNRLALVPDPDEEARRIAAEQERYRKLIQPVIDQNLARLRGVPTDGDDMRAAARRIADGRDDGIALLPLYRDAWNEVEKIGADRIAAKVARFSAVLYSAEPDSDWPRMPADLESTLRRSFRQFQDLAEQLVNLGYEVDDSTSSIIDCLANRTVPLVAGDGWSPQIILRDRFEVRWVNGDAMVEMSLWEDWDAIEHWDVGDVKLTERALPAKALSKHLLAVEKSWATTAGEAIDSGIVPSRVPPGDFTSWWDLEECILADEPETDYCFALPDGEPRYTLYWSWDRIQVQEAPGWILGREMLPAFVRSQRINRTEFRRLTSLVQHRQSPSVREMLHSKVTRDTWKEIVNRLRWIVPAVQPFGGADNPLNGLSEAQERQLLAGATIRFSSLEPRWQRSYRESAIEYSSRWKFRRSDHSWAEYEDEDDDWQAPAVTDEEWDNALVRMTIEPLPPGRLTLSDFGGREGRFYLSNPDDKLWPYHHLLNPISRCRIVATIALRPNLLIEEDREATEGFWPATCPKITKEARVAREKYWNDPKRRMDLLATLIEDRL